MWIIIVIMISSYYKLLGLLRASEKYGNPNVTKLPNSNSNVQNANSRVQKVKTANSRVQKCRGHGSCKISILLCSTSPFQNLEVPCMGMWVTWNWSGYWSAVFSLAYLRHVGPTSLQYRIPFDVGNGITKKLWCGYKLHLHHALLSCLKICLGRILEWMPWTGLDWSAAPIK